MIIHRGITTDTAIQLHIKSSMTSYIDEDVSRELDQIFGSKNGDYLIHAKQPIRENMKGEKFVIIQLEDKDKDTHTLFFKINIV